MNRESAIQGLVELYAKDGKTLNDLREEVDEIRKQAAKQRVAYAKLQKAIEKRRAEQARSVYNVVCLSCASRSTSYDPYYCNECRPK